MTNNGDVLFNIGYEYNSSQVNDVLNANKRIKQSLQDINPAAKDVSNAFKSTSQAIDDLTRRSNLDEVAQSYAKVAVVAKDVDAGQRQMVTSLRESGVSFKEQLGAVVAYKEEVKKLSQEQKQLTASQRFTTTRTLTSNARFAVSDIQRGDFGGAAVNAYQAAEAFKTLGLTLSSIVSFIAPFLVVAGAAVVLLELWKARQDTLNQANQKYVDGLKTWYEDIKNITTAEAELRNIRNQARLTDLVDERKRIQDRIDAFQPQQRLLRTDGAGAFIDRAGELDKAISDLVIQQQLLATSTNTEQRAAADAAAQFARNTDVYIQQINTQRELQQQLGDLIRNGTSKQFDEAKRGYDEQAQFAANAAAAIREKLKNTVFTDKDQDAKKKLQDELDALTNEYVKATSSSTAYTEAVRLEIVQRDAARKAIEQQLAGIQATAAVQAQIDAIIGSGTGTTAQIEGIKQTAEANKHRAETELDLLYATGQNDEATRARMALLANEIDLAQKQIDTVTTYQTALQGEIAERERITAITRIQLGEAQKYADSLTRQADLLKNATSEKLASDVADIDSREKIIKAQQEEIQKRLEVTGLNDEANAKLAALGAELEKLAAQRADIEAVKSIVEVRDALKVIGDSFKESFDAAQKFAQETNDAKQKQYEQEADYARDYADKIVDIAKKAAEDAEDALRKLGEGRDDATLNAKRDQAKDDRKIADDQAKTSLEYRRSEAKAYRDHYNDLLRIMREAQLREAELILNRDFAGLYLSRLKTVSDLQDKNSDFASKRISEAEKFKERSEDAAKERAAEARERAIALQEKLADLQREYDRGVEQRALNQAREEERAATDNERKLRDLDIQAQREAFKRQQDFAAELQQIAKNAGDRINLIAQEQSRVSEGMGGIISLFGQAAEAARQAVSRSLFGLGSGTGSSGSRYLARGGSASAFEAVNVNDGRHREGVNNVPFPPGQGVFIPFQNAYVQNRVGGSRGDLNMPISISGVSDPMTVVDMMSDMIDERISYFLEDE